MPGFSPFPSHVGSILLAITLICNAGFARNIPITLHNEMMLSTAIPFSSSYRSYLDLPTFTLPAEIQNESALVIRIHHLGTWALGHLGTQVFRRAYQAFEAYFSRFVRVPLPIMLL